MTEWPFSQDHALVVAHRGASSTHPENTLAAFEAAIDAGADAVEFDVRLTADGHAVVMHDASVDRTTDGSGPVAAMTLDALRALLIRSDAGTDARVPTLAETLALLSGRVGIDVEIKNTPGEPDFDPTSRSVVDAVIGTLEAVGFAGPVLLTSFNPWSLTWARERAPRIPTGLLTDPSVEAPVASRFAHEQGHAWVLPYAGRVHDAGRSFPDEVHAAGMSLGTWVVDDPGEAIALMRSGVDAVATNDPAPVVAARRDEFGS